MRRRVFFGVSAVALLLSGAYSEDFLTGDTKLSCEAILCLSSSTRPSECNPSLNRYFSINAKKWKDTVKKRKAFLQLCPTDNTDTSALASTLYTAEDQASFNNYRDNVLASSSDPSACTAAALNNTIETSYEDFPRSYRISPEIPSSCNAIYNSVYSDIARPTYVCNGEYYKTSAEAKKMTCWIEGTK